MSALIRKLIIFFGAAAISVGMAAVFVYAAPTATAAEARPAAAALPLRASHGMLTVQSGGAGPHRRNRHRHGHRRGHQHGRRTETPTRLEAYHWAAAQVGHPYKWGGTGPGFDCSGLVMMAYRHAGLDLPRTTSAMLSSPLLVRVVHPRMGDLAFYGSGHVELFRRWGYTFGAHDSDLPVGLIHYGWGWRPTAYYRVK
ncbi:MAG: C40 family peptidase [Streptosporangiaceae bacterium]